MAESATATIANNQLGPNSFQYSLSLTDAGTTTIGTFWFSWVPGQDFMAVSPTSIVDPTGWTHIVTNFGSSDGFAIQWTATSSASYLQSGQTLTGFSFVSSSTPAQISGNSVFFPSTPVLTSFVYSQGPFSDGGVEFTVSPACFLAGTRILTTRGEVAVEDLRRDDRIMTVSGEDRPLIWRGSRTIDCKQHKHPRNVWPVRIARDAIASGQPARDLFVSPDHAVFLDGMLIPARCLVNGKTIVQVPMGHVEYFHVELDRHDVLWAEGLPAESYLDTGDRDAFDNGTCPIALPADYIARVWEAAGYAPLVVGGAGLASVRHHLNARTALLTPRVAA
jgi:hypothetical protein